MDDDDNKIQPDHWGSYEKNRSFAGCCCLFSFSHAIFNYQNTKTNSQDYDISFYFISCLAVVVREREKEKK